MPILIDGWNLIRDDESDMRDDETDSTECARRLVVEMEQFRASHSDPITLVFDSSSGYLDIKYDNHPGLSIVAARDADDYIKRFIDRVPERQRRNLRVVSSDSDVFYYAKSSYATPLLSSDFWGTIRKSRRNFPNT